MTYASDIFYNVDSLSKAEKMTLLHDAIDLSLCYNIDELDCSKSFARVASKLTLDKFCNKIDTSKFIYWVFIHRKSGFPLVINGAFVEMSSYYEFGIRLGDNQIDYFIFVYMNIENGGKLVNKYELFNHIL